MFWDLTGIEVAEQGLSGGWRDDQRPPWGVAADLELF